MVGKYAKLAGQEFRGWLSKIADKRKCVIRLSAKSPSKGAVEMHSSTGDFKPAGPQLALDKRYH